MVGLAADATRHFEVHVVEIANDLGISSAKSVVQADRQVWLGYRLSII